MSRRRFGVAPLRAVLIILVVLVTRYNRVSTGITSARQRLRPSSIVLVGRRCGTLLHLLLRNEFVPGRGNPARQPVPLVLLLLLLLRILVLQGLAVSHARFLHRKTGVSPVSTDGGTVILQVTIPIPRSANVVQRRFCRCLEGRIALTRGVQLQLQRRRRRRQIVASLKLLRRRRQVVDMMMIVRDVLRLTAERGIGVAMHRRWFGCLRHDCRDSRFSSSSDFDEGQIFFFTMLIFVSRNSRIQVGRGKNSVDKFKSDSQINLTLTRGEINWDLND